MLLRFLRNLGKKNQTNLPANDSTKVIFDEDELNQEINTVLNKIETVLLRSYGPSGANTIINSNSIEPPKITKDGLTILENIFFDNAVHRNIHKIVLATAKNLAKTVGDGTTSSVLIAINLYRQLDCIKHKFNFNKKLIDSLSIASDLMIKNIDMNYTYRIDDTNRSLVLNSIASISNNNDSKLGSRVAQIFSLVPDFTNVKIDLDLQDGPVDIRHRIEQGFTFSGRIVHAAYLKDKPSITLINPLIFTSFEYFDEHAKLVIDLATKEKRPIVVVTEIVDSNALNTSLAMNLKGLPIYVIRSNSLASDEVRNEFIDLAIFNDSHITGELEKFTNEDLGNCISVDILPNRTIFNMGQGIVKGTEIYNKRLSEIQESLLNTPDNKPSIKGNLKTRLNKINGISIIMYVTGRTIEEKESAKFLVEDAVLACKSAIESGYTLGSNMASFYASRNISLLSDQIYETNNYNIQNLIDKETFNILLDAIHTAYYNIVNDAIYSTIALDNFNDYESLELCVNEILDNICVSDKDDLLVYNIINGNLENVKQTTILAPVNTDKEIIKTSFAIVATLLSANQYLLT
jgi:chaperonin GroEL (HSP60 family)